MITNQDRLDALGERPFGRSWYQYFSFPDNSSNIQFAGERGKLRTEIMTSSFESFPFLPSDVVLDIGSNSGLFGLLLSHKVSKSYSIELDPSFHMQAEYVKFMYEKYHRPEKHILINDDIFNRAELFRESSVILASKVFYHRHLFGNQDKLESLIFHSNLRGIIIQGHTTQGLYGTLPFMRELVTAKGMKIVYVQDHCEYPLVAALRI